MTKLVLIRHGQSIWNLENRFTGWIDVSLSKKGIKEAKIAAEKLADFKFDIAYTSTLIRAQNTLFEILNNNKHIQKYEIVHNKKWYLNYKRNENDIKYLKVYCSEKLNERYYGDLQGLNKDETAKKYGFKQVKLWRRSYDIAPPNGESLEMTSKRTLPYLKKFILPKLKKNNNIIISAHGNSLRSIIMFLEDLSKDEILDYEIPTGVPIVYTLNSKYEILKKEIL